MRMYCSRPTSHLHEIVVGPRVWFEVKLGQLVSAQPGQHAIEDVIVSFTFELKCKQKILLAVHAGGTNKHDT